MPLHGAVAVTQVETRELHAGRTILRAGRRIFAFCLLVLTLCALTACGIWHMQSAPPAEVLNTTRKQVRLTMVDGTQHTVNLARIEGDSVVGVHPRPTRTGPNAVSYPLADVRQVELAGISNARTRCWSSC